ncbi:unnamed protein product [Polarella glacialis]|uniref:Uncharacterized protein n=1 Tax=Polarella glacialis TaxID=89957 RepID=A0A813KTK3_POLGL|nr:unnamed protein product [Polarella glacialis]
MARIAASITSALALLLPGVSAAVPGSVWSVSDRVAAGECAGAALTSANKTSFLDDARVGPFFQSAAVLSAAADGITGADLISIAYGQHFKVLTEKMAKEQYVLTQCGMAQPTVEEVNKVAALPAGYQRKNFTIPLQRVATDSTVHLGFLSALGLQDRVAFMSSYATGPCWQKAAACGAELAAGGAWGNETKRALQLSAIEAVFMDCGVSDCGNVNSQGNGVHISASQDSGPLRQAEHLKFIAAFFNKEKEASAAFSTTLAAYAYAAALSATLTKKPVVAWISHSTYMEDAFVLSAATYKEHMVKDAGGTAKDGEALQAALGTQLKSSLAVSSNPAAGKTYTLNITAFASRAEAAAAFFKGLGDVDVVIDEVYASDPRAYTFSNFLEKYGLDNTSNLSFVKNRMVLRIDGTMSEANNLDWYESRYAHPELAVEGLARALYSNASKSMKYFRNVAKGEMPALLLASMCETAMPTCNSSVRPLAIPLTISDAAVASTTMKVTAVSTTMSLTAVSAPKGDATASDASQSSIATAVSVALLLWATTTVSF